MARLRPVPLGPDTLGSGVEVGRLHHASTAAACRSAADAPTTGRSCASHDQSSSLLLCCWRWRPRRARTTRPSRTTATPPADLAGADINRALARRAPGEHGRARPARSTCRRRGAARSATTDDTASTPPSPRRSADQGRLRLRAATSPTRSTRGATRCRPTSRASSSTWPLQTGGRRALRFDMGTECGPQYVDIQAVAAREPRAYVTRDYHDFDAGRTSTASLDEVGRRALGPADGPRDVFVLADEPHRRAACGASRRSSDDDRAGASNYSNAGGLTAIDVDQPARPRRTRRTGSRR